MIKLPSTVTILLSLLLITTSSVPAIDVIPSTVLLSCIFNISLSPTSSSIDEPFNTFNSYSIFGILFTLHILFTLNNAKIMKLT